MKSFFKVFLAALIGVMVGLFIFSIISFAMIGGIVGSMSSSTQFMLKDKTVFMIDLDGSFDERENENPLSSFTGVTSTGINDILESIKKAKESEQVKGIYLKCRAFSTGIANLEPLRKALFDFKESGKFIVSYSENYNQPTYYLASVADKIIINPQGSLDFFGLRSQLEFSRGMYEKMGIKHHVFKVGTYKSVVEPYIQDKMSDANREQTLSFLNDVWSHLLSNISESRNIPVETLNEYADKFLTYYEADSLIMFGMVDTMLYDAGVENYLKELSATDSDGKLNLASIKNMKSVKTEMQKKKSKNEVAVLYADGPIVTRDDNASFLSGNIIASEKYVTELKKLKNNKDVKAVVLRVNSPGGSVLASEQIWNALVELKKEKPVIVSMGALAASGGYYISCAATSIYAEPTTLTGSIGIFGLFAEGEELSKKMGVTFDEVKTNKHGGFGGKDFGIPFIVNAQSRAFTNEESQIMQKFVERGYDLFLTRCADGRSMTKEAIDIIGQGRVWTGKQALAHGLVDKLGGLDDAIKTAAEAADIENYNTKDYPAKEDFMTQLLKSSMGGAQIRIAKLIMGEEDYKQQMLIKTLKNSEFCVAEMPERISF